MQPKPVLPLRPVEPKDFHILQALRDLLVASDPYGRTDPSFCSAFHQARLVLVQHREHLPLGHARKR